MNGFIEKYKANASRLKDSDLAKLAADMEKGGYDANDEQWAQLTAAVDALPPETPEEKAAREADDAKAAIEKATGDPAAHKGEHFVSGDKPGYGSNPIGYPGTDQDQEAPGTKPKTVPGQKPVKKPGE